MTTNQQDQGVGACPTGTAAFVPSGSSPSGLDQRLQSTSGAHTPGPWEWDAGVIPPDGPGRYADIYVLDEDREPIILAEFNDNIPGGRANGYLMATSPDLLAAVIQYRDDLRYPPAPDSIERRLEMIEKLIAKATGAA